MYSLLLSFWHSLCVALARLRNDKRRCVWSDSDVDVILNNIVFGFYSSAPTLAVDSLGHILRTKYEVPFFRFRYYWLVLAKVILSIARNKKWRQFYSIENIQVSFVFINYVSKTENSVPKMAITIRKAVKEDMTNIRQLIQVG